MISSRRVPAGLKTVLRPPADRRSRLVLTGRPVSGTTTVRIRLGGAERWIPAPAGTVTRSLTGGDPIEVVVYSDSPFEYELRRLAIEDCPSCRVDDDLKQELGASIPGLDGLVRNDPVEAAVKVLRWAAPKIDFALAPQLLLEEASAADVASAYYESFEPDRKGVYCGGAAVFFASVLRLVGLDATTIDFGVPGTDLTHVTVLLAVAEDGGPRFFLIDPTFNAVFRRQAGASIADLATILELAADRRLAEVGFEEGILIGREWLLPRDPVSRSRHPQIAARCEQEKVRSPGDFDVCDLPQFGMDRYLRLNRPALSRAGIPADQFVLVHLLRHQVFGIGSFASPATRAALVHLLAGADVTLAAGIQPGSGEP